VGHLLAYSLAIVPTLWLGGLWWKRRAARAHLTGTRNAA
jgi:hypothetical protein